MKKLLSMLLAAMLLVLPLAVAEGIDFAAMTDEELQAVIDGAKSEQAKRQPAGDGNEIIVDQDGITVTVTGNNQFEEYSPILDVEAIIENNSEKDVVLYVDTASINEWNVTGYGLPPVSAGKKVKGNFELWLDDTDVTAIEDIETVGMELSILDEDTYSPIGDPISVTIRLK